MSKAVMALSTKQAQAVATELGVDLPRKDNGWRTSGELRLCRLPQRMRKSRRNAQAYRLTAPKTEDLHKFFPIVNGNGRAVCIVVKND